MITKTCGCATESCGCCEGIEILTPVSTVNRPGLDSLLYRAGTHGTFFETMKARLAGMTVEAPGKDGQTIETFQPLLGLTTRESSDPAIALLDSWATVGDVLTFYQERIANEGYLRTATERRSILELARLVGYTLRPGVASTVFLAYTLEDKQLVPVEIPAGARSQSIPGPGELPQAFETSEALRARTEWNNLQVRRKRPQNITLENALAVETLYVAGANTNLKVGDVLLFVFGVAPDQRALRFVEEANAEFAESRTKIVLQPVPRAIGVVLPLLRRAISELKQLNAPSEPGIEVATEKAQRILEDNLAGFYDLPEQWEQDIRDAVSAAEQTLDPETDKILKRFGNDVEEVKNSPEDHAIVTDPAAFVQNLLKEPVPQAVSSLQLGRNIQNSLQRGTDVHPKLLLNFAPRLKDSFYIAWANARVNHTPSALEAVYVVRVTAPLFGATVPKQATYYPETKRDPQTNTIIEKEGQLMPPEKWLEWRVDKDERDNAVFLDQAYEAIQPRSYVIIQYGSGSSIRRDVTKVSAMQITQRTAYGISGKTTHLILEDPWWKVEHRKTDEQKRILMETLRSTLVYAQSEKLTLVEELLSGDVEGQEIPLDALYNELTSGRWVIFSGERADIKGVTGVRASELLMISGLRQDYDAKLPGDKTHTTLLLATPTAYSYKRDTLTIYGNVVKATHGETRNETLGSGDGSQALQSFALKQPPLTFVPAPTPAGVDSTLKVYVNDVEWHETATLAGLGSKGRNFITKTDDEDKTTAIFGNGVEGARLPTGIENVKAVYRNGIGKPGNVLAEQISLLQTRPLGVKSVINPLRASGGADKERRDQARENAPLAVMALDRLVSVQDYDDFTRTFAGIGKAAARRLSDGRRELVHVTIAGADDIPIDPISDLYRNLLIALREFGDIDLPVQVDSRELLVLVLSAKIRLQPDYQWDPVAKAIQDRILESFGFEKGVLGQPALLCEIIALVQNTDGVAYVDVDAFGGIPEKTAEADGKRRLLTLDELALAAKMVVYAAYSYLLFETDDFKDLGRLVKKLVDAPTRGAVSEFLWKQFSAQTQKLLSSGQSVPQEQRAALIKELNKVLLGDSIYDAKHFSAAGLSPEIGGLLKQNPQGGDLIRLNRLLLESAYPTEIAKSQNKLQQHVPFGPALRVDANLADFENGALRPAQLAVFMAAVPETIVLNQIK